MGSSLARTEKEKGRALRYLFLAAGLVFVGIGYIGIIVPGVPSTICFICAVWAFKKSSPRFESWLLNHKVFGPTLRDWEEHKAITLRTKWIAILTMAAFASISLFVIHKLWVKLLVAACVALVAIYIATRKTKV